MSIFSGNSHNRFWVWGGIGFAVLFGLGLWWLVQISSSSKPIPGKEVADLGRDHVSVGTKATYNSNPPTSGDHYEDWIKKGIYTEPVEDGYLIHSLEHGYVVISYNCEKKVSKVPFIPQVFAHDEKGASDSAKIPSKDDLKDPVWQTKECGDLKKQLEEVAKENTIWKLIVIPRPHLDAKIALTAWNHIDKMNSLDKDRIKRFIDAYRDKGPERTMEP